MASCAFGSVVIKSQRRPRRRATAASRRKLKTWSDDPCRCSAGHSSALTPSRNAYLRSKTRGKPRKASAARSFSPYGRRQHPSEAKEQSRRGYIPQIDQQIAPFAPSTISGSRAPPAAVAAMFYSAIVRPGKAAAYVPPPEEHMLHLSQACLAHDVPEGTRVSLLVKSDRGEEAALLCTLCAGRQDTVPLDQYLAHYAEFSVAGGAAVHLSGWVGACWGFGRHRGLRRHLSAAMAESVAAAVVASSVKRRLNQGAAPCALTAPPPSKPSRVTGTTRRSTRRTTRGWRTRTRWVRPRGAVGAELQLLPLMPSLSWRSIDFARVAPTQLNSCQNSTLHPPG
jgi:hypothetical protein